MRKTTVYLDDEVAVRLRQISAAQRRPQAELIREALAAYTAKAKRRIPEGIGKFRSGRSNLSERAEELFGEIVRKRHGL